MLNFKILNTFENVHLKCVPALFSDFYIRHWSCRLQHATCNRPVSRRNCNKSCKEMGGDTSAMQVCHQGRVRWAN